MAKAAPLFTYEELKDYLDFCSDAPASTMPAGYKESQASIQKALIECEYIKHVAPHLLVCMLIGGPDMLMCSSWGTGFSMGVEFERRRAEQKELERMMGTGTTKKRKK